MASNYSRNNDLNFLHPLVRQAAIAVQSELDKDQIPLRVFEGFRYPERQADLFAKGRTAPGKIVTYAEPWRSYHQYGMAVDFVIYENEKWNWDASGAKKKWWQKMHDLGKKNGLMRLDFETPHLQLAGTSSSALANGHYPDGGDDSWAENLAAAIAAWRGSPSAPPKPPVPERPEL